MRRHTAVALQRPYWDADVAAKLTGVEVKYRGRRKHLEAGPAVALRSAGGHPFTRQPHPGVGQILNFPFETRYGITAARQSLNSCLAASNKMRGYFDASVIAALVG
jgi:hypothetical protein